MLAYMTTMMATRGRRTTGCADDSTDSKTQTTDADDSKLLIFRRGEGVIQVFHNNNHWETLERTNSNRQRHNWAPQVAPGYKRQPQTMWLAASDRGTQRNARPWLQQLAAVHLGKPQQP